MCSAASPPAQKSSAELSFGACRRSPRPCIPVPASPSSMTLLASEFFNLREKRVTKEAELSVLKESASFLPLGFPQPYKPSTKPERAGTLPDTEISQSHGASLSSLHQCHSSQLVFAGSWVFFFNHNFSLFTGAMATLEPVTSVPVTPHLQQQEHGPARQPGQLRHSDPAKRESAFVLPELLSCRALALTPQMCKYLKGQGRRGGELLQKVMGQKRR